MISDILQAGDKVEIRPVQQWLPDEEVPYVYKSMVQEIHENGEVDISMPVEEGKYVLLHIGARFEFVFYGESNVYRGVGQIKERFKTNNIYILRIEMKTQLGKLQRREYYRFPCVLDMKYFRIANDISDLDDPDQILELLQEGEPEELEKSATILDISGGGARFVSEEQFETNQYVLMELNLITENMNKEYCIKGRIVSWKKLDTPEPKYETRLEFVMKDNKVREDIIRYIFEEERIKRRREKG